MLVSIGIINYNNQKYIERAIRSCQNQFRSNHNIEIVVVDDCSTDSTLDEIDQFHESIALYRNEKNMGAGFSAQLALEKSTGKYFMRVDSDDFISQFTTGVFANFLEENKEIDLVFGNLQVVDPYGKKLGVIDMAQTDNLIDYGAGILFKRSKLLEVGGYNKSLRHGEDIDLMLKLLRAGASKKHLPLNFYRYYRHGTNKSSSALHQEAKKELRRIYDF